MSDEEIKNKPRGGYRPGAGRPKGSGKGTKLGRDAYWAQRVGEIKKRLSDAALGKCEMQPSQVKAAEVILDRHEPKLSSIEHSEANPRDAADPAQLVARLAALFTEKPQLLEQIRELMAGASPQTASSEPAPQVTH